MTTTHEIAEFNAFEASLAEFKGRYIGIVYDLDEPEQEKQARSDRLTIGKTISQLDKVHRELKAPIKAQSDILDGERKRIKDDLLGVQLEIKSQITQHEDKVEAIESALAGRVDAIRALGTDLDPYTSTSQEIKTALDAAEAVVIDDSFQTHEANAALAKLKTIQALAGWLVQAISRETQEAENRRLRAELAEREQAERDERIAKQAAEDAAEMAAQADHQRVVAERRAAAAEERAVEAEDRRKQAEIVRKQEALALAEQVAEQKAVAALQAELDKHQAIEQAQEA